MNRSFEVASCDHHSGQFSLLGLTLSTGRTALIAQGWQEEEGVTGQEWFKFTWFEFVTDQTVDPSDTSWIVSAQGACVLQIPETLRFDSALGCGIELLSDTEISELFEEFPDIEFFEP
jgi:hypothetical protein